MRGKTCRSTTHPDKTFIGRSARAVRLAFGAAVGRIIRNGKASVFDGLSNPLFVDSLGLCKVLTRKACRNKLASFEVNYTLQ
jgi:hypothetical protein